MAEAIVLILGLIVMAAAIIAVAVNAAGKAPTSEQVQPETMRCPNCGSPATVKGSQWECGYCGDYGRFP